MLNFKSRRLVNWSVLLIGLGAAKGASAAEPVPKGEVTKHTFAASKIFPGTTRNYWVYVPKQYDPAKPACLYVNQDGVQYKAPEVFDDLIARKEMPITIGVFVQPGVVKAIRPDALDRLNRSFEYDGLGDGYVRFLVDELLPVVETLKTSDGRAIRLSKDGNDRAIGGASSGAICAFTAAWERSDSFRRVFSSIGTYVGLRGGNVYPTLIRKYEPKPIRIFLQDGSSDLNHWGGDWWMANQEMERSFIFAGYEVDHIWGTGGHNSTQATQVFPDAMRWLWKDWPKPVKAGAGSPHLREIVIPGEDWSLVAEGYKFTEGPAADALGEVYFTDIPNHKIHKIGSDGNVTLFVNDPKENNGLAFGPDGKLYAAAQGAMQILAYDPSGKAEVIADGFRGNDLVVRPDGSMYVTNPTDKGMGPSTVWYISPTREKKQVDTGLVLCNGIAMSPDQSLLYVADSRSHWVYSFQIQADGSLADKQKYFHLHTPDRADYSGADGMKVDRQGRLYVTTSMGIQVCDPGGRVTCILPTPNGRVANLCFGGPNLDILYAMCGDRVYSRKVKTRGVRTYEAPITLPGPRP